jgi:hypothetical protein
MSQPYLKVTTDFTEKFNDIIKRFKNDAVLVGIPSSKSAREDDSEITNAAILAINHFGSPANHIPPRPVMTIGIKNAQDKIAEEFKKAAQATLTKGTAALEIYYERAGIIASTSVKKVINDQEGIQGPSDATLKAREYLTKAGFKGTKSLVVTGQMRNAITYVVKSIWGR